MPDDKSSQVADHHIRIILDELRSDVDAAFSDLQLDPGAQGCRRRAVRAAIGYLDVARTCMEHPWAHATAHRLLTLVPERPSQELNRRLKQRGIPPWSQKDRPH